MSRIIKRLSALLVALLTMFMVASTAMADMNGIGVSGWQPVGITRQVKADFAVVKVTQNTGFVNTVWRAQAQGALDTGKKLGLYHYAGGNNPTAEANHFINHARSYVGRAVLVLDWESYQNSAWGNGNWVREFIQRIHTLTGVWPMVYVQASAIWQIPSDVRQVRIVGAQYASNAATGWQTRPWKYGAYGEAMRQYTSNGRLPGYNGPLDLNVFRSEAWQWDKYASPNGAAKPSQPTPQPQVDTIDWNALADKAIRGDFGNSEARKAALGDKYAKVQSIVNQRLGGATTTAAPAPVASTTSVRVCSGDTISGIAVRTGLWPVTAWRVPSGNINLIYPGNIVTYRSTASSASSGSVATGGRVHVVNSGETLSGIFGANGWQRVTQLNNLANPNLIYPGQRLRY
ncbi:GH25 family lysozyme [Bifidobacterium bifidum]|uniref:GH25 family lysozyme n=1 Tax=Bifidobacterium bifidum TaxID=1681 RepID=UPI003D08138F